MSCNSSVDSAECLILTYKIFRLTDSSKSEVNCRLQAGVPVGAATDVTRYATAYPERQQKIKILHFHHDRYSLLLNIVQFLDITNLTFINKLHYKPNIYKYIILSLNIDNNLLYLRGL